MMSAGADYRERDRILTETFVRALPLTHNVERNKLRLYLLLSGIFEGGPLHNNLSCLCPCHITWCPGSVSLVRLSGVNYF
jgi:hypothetical protein